MIHLTDLPIISQIRMMRVLRVALFGEGSTCFYHCGYHPVNHPGTILAYSLLAAFGVRSIKGLHETAINCSLLAATVHHFGINLLIEPSARIILPSSRHHPAQSPLVPVLAQADKIVCWAVLAQADNTAHWAAVALEDRTVHWAVVPKQTRLPALADKIGHWVVLAQTDSTVRWSVLAQAGRTVHWTGLAHAD